MAQKQNPGQGLLFEVPAPPPKMRRRPGGGADVKYTRFKPKRRTLCDDCTQDIHTRGVGVAPLPAVVAWRCVTTATGTAALLCDPHKRTRAGES